MAKIKVDLNAFYGYGHGGCSYGSDETIEIEVNEQELEALRKLGDKEISCEAVVKAVESGESVLKLLHEQLEDKFYYMVEEYWLYDADNECLEECLMEHIEDDIDSGEFESPMSFEDFVEALQAGEIDYEMIQFGYFDDIDEDYDYEDEDDLQDKYDSYILDKYYDWVREHDHAFVAERVGLDLFACRDDKVNYTITVL